ncbi:MAG: MBL fold metallo-hydrolase [Candidatus Electrothrix sp. ATG1]|nr:MBL fold metallo-hydrolase [Candidatus Electrothrix sp. ATG1]
MFPGAFFFRKNQVRKVTYLDVGQGTSSFLQLTNGSRLLIDGGGNRKSRLNIGEQIIGPYLWKQRVWRLDQAVITHPHSDHFNGMDFILTHFRPKKLFINGDPRVEGKYQEIINQAEQLGIAVLVPRTGENIVEQEDTEVTILSGAEQTTGQSRGSVNDTSLVLRYRYRKQAFLFPGDISNKKEKVLLEQQTDLTADVLLAPHHGSSTSSSPAFISAVDPQLIVISAGRYGKKYYPAPVNLAVWSERRIPVAVTREHGTISCETDGNQLRCLDFWGTVVLATASNATNKDKKNRLIISR